MCVHCCRQLQAAHPCASAPHSPRQPNWDWRANLVKDGCRYCATGCAFGLRAMLGAHVGSRRQTQCEGSLGPGEELVSKCLFWAL